MTTWIAVSGIGAGMVLWAAFVNLLARQFPANRADAGEMSARKLEPIVWRIGLAVGLVGLAGIAVTTLA